MTHSSSTTEAPNARVHLGGGAITTTQAAWTELLSKVTRPAYFQFPEVHQRYLDQLGAPDSLVVIELLRGQRCVGIIAAERARARLAGMNFDSLALPYHPHFILSDAVLADGEKLVDFWPSIGTALAQSSLRWEALRFPCALAGGAALTAASDLEPLAFERRLRASNYFDCTGPYEQISARYTDLRKKNLQKGWKRIERTGAFEVKSVRGSEEGLWAFDEFLRIEGSGWKGQQGSSIAADPKLAQFWKELFLLQSAGLYAEINLMMLDGAAIAGQFCVVSGRTAYVHKIAYDEAHKRLSPGHLFIEYLLKKSCADPQIDIVSVVSGAAWHADWAPIARDVHEVWLFRRGWQARLVRLAVSLIARIRRIKQRGQQPGT